MECGEHNEQGGNLRTVDGVRRSIISKDLTEEEEEEAEGRDVWRSTVSFKSYHVGFDALITSPFYTEWTIVQICLRTHDVRPLIGLLHLVLDGPLHSELLILFYYITQ